MTDAPPRLFDRALWLARRARRALPRPDARFLHAAAADAVAERLDSVARDFPDALLAWPGAPDWAETLAAHPKIGTLTEIAPPADEILTAAPETCDLAILGLTLHWVDDPVGALIQLRRALRPDGLLIACGFGGETLAELRDAFAQAEAEVEGGLSPRVSPMGEIRALGGLAQRAGLALPVVDSDRLDVTYADPLALMRDLRAMGEANAQHDRRRTPLRRATLARACEIYAERHPAREADGRANPEGRVRATFEIVTLTGWAPGPDQPQPKRPGSATKRLADALGVPELKAGEKAGK